MIKAKIMNKFTITKLTITTHLLNSPGNNHADGHEFM